MLYFRVSGHRALEMRSCAPDTSCIFNQSISSLLHLFYLLRLSLHSLFAASFSLSLSLCCYVICTLIIFFVSLCFLDSSRTPGNFIYLSGLSHLTLSLTLYSSSSSVCCPCLLFVCLCSNHYVLSAFLSCLFYYIMKDWGCKRHAPFD